MAIDQIVNKLKGNPIFRMSLGAKELFHSNFLEYLWGLNNELFIKIMNGFIKFKPSLPSNDKYEMGRELENFDICIYHYNAKDKMVYDMIIENKVKSIPYKEQLKNYEKKAQQHSGCRFMLLTLSKKFPDIHDQALSNWIVIGYDDLLKGIRNLYLNSTNNISGNDRCYIQDYCSFIEHLNKLKDDVILQNINEQLLFNDNDINKLKGIRLHDLYIKMRISWFLTELKKKLEDKGIQPIVVHKYKEIHQNHKKKGVYLNVDMNQGNGQIAAWINDRNGDIGNTLEIVIQGNQYRHGISHRTVKTNTKGNDRLNDLYKRLQNPTYKNALSFLNFGQSQNVKPDNPTNFRKSSLEKEGPFCCYDDGYIYRYINVRSWKISRLLEMMTKDILQLYNNIPSL